MPEQFKDRLKKWRGKKYQKEAADLLGVPLPTYRKWECGKRTPNKFVRSVIDSKITPNV